MADYITNKWINNFKQSTTAQQLAILIVENPLKYKPNIVKLWDALENKDIFFIYVEYVCLDKYYFVDKKLLLLFLLYIE